jgi:hypothetical protein
MPVRVEKVNRYKMDKNCNMPKNWVPNPMETNVIDIPLIDGYETALYIIVMENYTKRIKWVEYEILEGINKCDDVTASIEMLEGSSSLSLIITNKKDIPRNLRVGYTVAFCR